MGRGASDNDIPSIPGAKPDNICAKCLATWAGQWMIELPQRNISNLCRTEKFQASFGEISGEILFHIYSS